MSDLKKVNIKDVYNIINNNLDDVVKSKSYHMYDKIQKRLQGQKWFDSSGWWQILNGKVQPYKNSTRQELGLCPNFCPKCNKSMNHYIDKHIWKYRGYCNSCLAKYETQLKLNGTYQMYVNINIMRNYLAYVNDARQQIKQYKFDVQVLRQTIDNDIQIDKWSSDQQLLSNLKNKWITQLDQWQIKVKQLLKQLQLKFDNLNKNKQIQNKEKDV